MTTADDDALSALVPALDPDVAAEVERFREDYVALSDAGIHEVNSIMRPMLLQDRKAMARQTEFWRREAAEEYTEARAQDRMRDKDADFDAPLDLSEVWDADPIRPTVCAMTNGLCLIYEGFRNVVFGPSEAGKTWLAVLAVVQEVKAGRPVIYLDYENGAHGMKDRLKSFGVTSVEAKEYVRYFSINGTPPSPAKATAMALDLVADGGRLVVMDTTTPGMRSMGLNPLVEVDVENFYVLAGDPWAKAGCAWLTVDHTPSADTGKQYGNQQKKAGVSGMSINVVANVPFNRRMAGFSDVYIEKDRHGGGPEATGEHRHVAQLHIKPGVTVGSATGVLELVPVDAASLSAQAEDKAREAEAAEALSKTRVKKQIREWVREYDDGTGLVHSWLKNSDRKGRVPRLAGAGVRSDTVMKWATEMLNDPSDPLVTNAKGRMVLDTSVPEPGEEATETTPVTAGLPFAEPPTPPPSLRGTETAE